MAMLAAAALTSPAQAQTGSLQDFPESDVLISLNARRLLTEALPRILPEAEAAKMRASFNDLKGKTGIDVTGIDNAIIALRFKRGANGQPVPEMFLNLRGSFNASALVSAARMALQGKFRDEKVGTKTLTVLNMSQVVGPGGKNPLPFNIAEIALYALDANTIVGGSLNYVKEAIGEGGKRISPELAALGSRDSTAVVAIAGAFQAGALGNLLPAEVRGNQEVMNVLGGIDQIYISVGMDAADFPLFAMIHTVTPEQANTISGLLGFAIPALSAGLKDPAAKGIVDAMKITTQGNEVQLRTSVPQSVLASLVQSMMKTQTGPPPPEVKKADSAKKP
jgi:hypothetical protein